VEASSHLALDLYLIAVVGASMDSKLIGCYDDSSFGSFPGFGNRIISAVFSCSGQKQSLNMYVSMTSLFLGSLDWIGLAQDRYRWRALVNSVMNLRVP
jgi:hypothetical protein